MKALPTGTVTFLFTDIQGSTRLWQSNPHQMKKALVRHDKILRKAIEENGGFVFKTVGDAFCAAFDTAMEGLKAALAAQLAINASEWETPGPIRVRMALHTGEAIERDRDYYGPALNRVARLEAIGHGGQTLVSLVAAELVRDMLPENVELKDLGDRRLKDLIRAETVYQLRHPDLPDEFPPLKSLDMHPHNLPMQPTPLIGREKELESLGALLHDTAVRVVTLTGPGGMGKTRLALQVAADQIDGFEDGAFFVDLAPVSDPQLMIPVLAQTLHIKESGNRGLVEIVKEYLCGKRMLLLLDNFEQIMDAALQVVALLGSCPGVKFLVTSREALHVRGEKVFAVPALSMPEPQTAAAVEIESITQYEAVRLFVERAVAVRQEFQVTNENAPAVAEICVRLDGIPLAIELAAARVRLLSPQAILSRLDHRLKLLTGGARDLPNRQKTLRATIDWSHELLDKPCRELFRDLAVFVGGFTLEAAEAVYCGGEFSDGRILDGIESLVDKSLVCLEERAATAAEAEPRFHLLETIREFGLERLAESGREQEIRGRHAQYYLDLAERAEPELERKDQKVWLDRLEREHENIRAAFNWFSKEKRWEEALRLAGSLWYFWRTRGYLREGRVWLEHVISNCGVDRGSNLARAVLGVGCLCRNQGLFDEAMTNLLKSLDLFQKAADRAGAVRSYYELGFVSWTTNKLKDANTYFESGNLIASETGDELYQACTLSGLGLVEWKNGQMQTAKKYFENSRTLFNRLGDVKREGGALSNIGVICYEQDNFDAARSYFEKALEVQRSIGDFDNMRSVLNNLGYLNYKAREYEKSKKYYLEILIRFENSDDCRIRSTALAGLADVHLCSGDTNKAIECARRGVEEVKELESSVELAICLRAMGDVCLQVGETEKAKEAYERCIPMLEEAMEKEDLDRAIHGYERVLSLIEQSATSDA